VSRRERAHLADEAPEVFGLVREELWRRNDVTYVTVHDFLLGLCDFVDHTERVSDIAPPPFVPVEGTYNPPKHGTALYFTPTGEMGRYARRYGRADVPEPEAGCTKTFSGHRHHTGGIFT
jgi:hypothetical protein